KRTASITRIGTATTASKRPRPWLILFAASSLVMPQALYIADFQGQITILCYCFAPNGKLHNRNPPRTTRFRNHRPHCRSCDCGERQKENCSTGVARESTRTDAGCPFDFSKRR